MQKRALLIAAAVLLVLALRVWHLHRSPADPAEEDGDTGLLLPGLELDDVVGIAIGPEGKGATLSLDGERWVVAPGSHPAEVALAHLAVRALTRTGSLRRFDGVAPSPEFGLGEGATDVLVTLRDGAAHRLQLGDAAPVGDGRYVAVDGVLHLADPTALGVLERDPTDFRDRRLLPLDRAAIDGLLIASPEGGAVELRREEGIWRLAGEPAWRAEYATVDGLLRDLVGMTATRYTDAPAPHPALRVELRRGDEAASILLGPADEAGHRAAWSEGELLPAGVGRESARVRAPFLDALPDAGGWRSVALASFDPEDVARFIWAAGGETWNVERTEHGWHRADQPELPLDSDGVEALLAGVTGLTATGILEQDEAEGAVEVASFEVSLADGDGVRLELLRAPNLDLVRIEGEPGLREVAGVAHDLLGRLRPFEPPAVP